MVASLTAVPVIGVPIKTKTLEGLDSLLSVAQMPPGVPVATVAINGAKNAGLLACQILGTKYSGIRTKIEEYKYELEQNVLKKARKLEKSGVEGYLRGL
jgi:5-(carboxyamino)imidazole ribonucleotide mutase